MPRLIIDWGSDDEGLQEMLKTIESTPKYSSLRFELEAALHAFMAQWNWKQAALAERREAEQRARDARREARKAAKEAADAR